MDKTEAEQRRKEEVEEELLEKEDEDIIRKLAYQQVHRLTVTLCLLIITSFIMGYFQLSFLIPLLLCVYAAWVWKLKANEIQDWFYHEHEMREHRRRAFDHAETVEWMNFLLNRWWFFSDETIFQLLKKGIDPVLEGCKPKVIDTIEVHKFTLGNRTPYFKYLRAYDLTEDQRKQAASEVIYRNPPVDLPIRPKYQVAIDCEMAMDAPESKLIILVKLNSRLGFTEIIIDKFKIRGRVQVILSFNQNIPFPHLAAFSVSFLQEPKVNFDVRLLKKLQLMEFPLIRDWISELVNDSLKVTLVDPGHLTIPLCNDPDLMGRQSGYCAGVLTVTIKGGSHGKATSDEQWCTVTLEKQKVRTKEISADVLWQEQVSLLVGSLQYDKLRIKIKGKRRFGPNYTIVEYILPLIRLNLEQNPEQNMELQDDNIVGSFLQVCLNYSPLAVIDVTSDEETFKRYFIERNDLETPSEVAGVLFVCVHKGTNLIPMDSSGLSDPYVMIFANKEIVKTSHVIEETLNPVWETKVEFFTADYTKTTLSFVVQDQNQMVLPNVLLSADNDDFMGSCNMKLTKEDWCVFKNDLDVSFMFHGDVKKGQLETVKKVGKLTVTVIFRPISSVKNTTKLAPNAGFPEGEPLNQKRTKIDAVAMEAILSSERGSLTLCILRARNLVAFDLNGRSDPFVIVRVGDSKQEKFKTKIIYRTLNPVWNEQVTFAMPQKHERVNVEIWDKDSFTQEKMGIIRFTYDDLLNLGKGGLNEKHWFNIEKAKSGELQLSFQTSLPSISEKTADSMSDGRNDIIESYAYGSEDSDEDFLILDHRKRTLSQQKINDHLVEDAREDEEDIDKKEEKVEDGEQKTQVDGEQYEEDSFSTDNNGFVDFSGDPDKYFGLHGRVHELIELNSHADIDEVYIKIKLDSTPKFQKPMRRNLLNRNDRILCRTSNFRVEQRMYIDEAFQMKNDVGISPCIYLVLEVKSDKKGKDVIDSHSMLLRNFFKGELSATKLIELDNGGKMRLEMSHTPIDELGTSNTMRRRYSLKQKFRASFDALSHPKDVYSQLTL